MAFHISHPNARRTEMDLPRIIWRRKWQPTPVFLPGESQGQGSLVGCRLWGRTESDTTQVMQQQQQQPQNLARHVQLVGGRKRLPWWLSGKESTCQCRSRGFDPCVGKIPWRRAWQPTPVFLPGKSQTKESGRLHSPWGQTRVGHN